MNHLEMTKHIRNRVRAAGIKARVRKYVSCGTRYIQVVIPDAEWRWSAEQIVEIGLIGQANRLTFARRSSIDLDLLRQLTGKTVFNFEYHGENA